jgi:putative tricarboxylic transport membrane protein
MSNCIIAIFLILLAVVYFYATSQIPSYEVGDPLGAKVFPTLLGIGLVLAALLLLFETYKTKSRENSEKERESKKERRHLVIVGSVVCWTIIFIILLEYLGFLLSSMVYLIVFMTCLNSKKVWLHMGVSVVFSVALYILLAKGLGVTLPKGILYY